MSLEVQKQVRNVIQEKLPEYDLDSADMYWTDQGEWCTYDWKLENASKIMDIKNIFGGKSKYHD